MHEQSPLGGQFFLGTIVGIQIHKKPVATHAQLEMGGIQTPFGSQSTRGRGVYGVGSVVRVQPGDNVGSQLELAWCPFVDPSHMKGKLSSPNHLSHLMGVIHFLRVQEQIPVLRPLEAGVQLGAIVLGQFGFRLGTVGQCSFIAMYEGIEKLLSPCQQVLLDHVSSNEVEFLSVMVVSIVPRIQQPYVPSNVDYVFNITDQIFCHEGDVGDGQSDQTHLPIGSHETNGSGQSVLETVGLVGGKLVLVVLAQERHVERMQGGERHGRFLFLVFFGVVVRA